MIKSHLTLEQAGGWPPKYFSIDSLFIQLSNNETEISGGGGRGRSGARNCESSRSILLEPVRSDKIIASKRISIGLARERFIGEIYKPATSCQPSIDTPPQSRISSSPTENHESWIRGGGQRRSFNNESVESSNGESSTNFSSLIRISPEAFLISYDPEKRFLTIPPNETIFHLSTLSRR